MVRQRVRICFSKQDDLRWLSHRDLMRTWERLLRRAEVPLGMSEGFHPKPRMNFPSALAVGIAGLDEVGGNRAVARLDRRRIASGARAALAAGARPATCRSDARVDSARRKRRASTSKPDVPAAAASRGSRAHRLAARPKRRIRSSARGVRRPLDLRPLIEQLTLSDGVLRMRLRVDRQGTLARARCWPLWGSTAWNIPVAR